MTKIDDKKFIEWAKEQAIPKDLQNSGIFVGVCSDDQPWSAARIEFMLQIGYCLLTEKPIILALPHGQTIPEKLEAVATKIVRYDPKDLSSMKAGLANAFTELGVRKM